MKNRFWLYRRSHHRSRVSFLHHHHNGRNQQTQESKPTLFSERRTDAQLVLYDSIQWDHFQYPGIGDLLFEEMYLWSAIAWRVNRYFIPKIPMY